MEARRCAWRRITDHTLQPTALVHEAYLGWLDGATTQRWAGRGHFLRRRRRGHARILIESARRKHGTEPVATSPAGFSTRISLACGCVPTPSCLDGAVDRLVAIEPRAAEVVKLRYFAGLTVEEAAAILGISARTADNDPWLTHGPGLSPPFRRTERFDSFASLIRLRRFSATECFIKNTSTTNPIARIAVIHKGHRNMPGKRPAGLEDPRASAMSFVGSRRDRP